MGRAYEGSLLQWIDQHGGATYTADQLFQMAQAEGKDYPYDKIRSARNTRRGVTIVLGPNGVPVRGAINKQMAERPRLTSEERAKPGFYSNHPHKPAAPRVAPEPKRRGRPTKAAVPEQSLGERVRSIGSAMQAPPPVAVPAAPSIDPRQGALDLGIRRPAVKAPPVAARTAVAEPVPKAPRKAVRAQTDIEPSEQAELSLPPPKHTALRKLILDVGLDAARDIIAEFEDVSERIR